MYIKILYNKDNWKIITEMIMRFLKLNKDYEYIRIYDDSKVESLNVSGIEFLDDNTMVVRCGEINHPKLYFGNLKSDSYIIFTSDSITLYNKNRESCRIVKKKHKLSNNDIKLESLEA